MDGFEQATRLKLRFDTAKGQLSTEDVWDLPLTSANGVSLDGLAKQLNKAVKESAEESFVVKKTKANAELELRFDIVKHIIAVRLKEAEDRANEAAVKAKKARILDIIANKEDDELASLPVSELKKMAKKM